MISEKTIELCDQSSLGQSEYNSAGFISTQHKPDNRKRTACSVCERIGEKYQHKATLIGGVVLISLFPGWDIWLTDLWDSGISWTNFRWWNATSVKEKYGLRMRQVAPLRGSSSLTPHWSTSCAAWSQELNPNCTFGRTLLTYGVCFLLICGNSTCADRWSCFVERESLDLWALCTQCYDQGKLSLGPLPMCLKKLQDWIFRLQVRMHLQKNFAAQY